MSAAITGTVTYSTPLAGKRLLVLTAAITSADDAITLTLAAHGVRTLYAVFGQITGGMDNDFQTLQISYSGLVITIVSCEADGTAADEFTGTTITLLCIVD